MKILSRINPWYVAIKPFNPLCGKSWTGYIEWSGLKHLKEVMSLDVSLCPRVIRNINKKDWEHNIHEDFLLDFFWDLDYLITRIKKFKSARIIAVLRDPNAGCRNALRDERFVFLGYDIVDVHVDVSILTNCGGFPKVFKNEELSEIGLIRSFSRAIEINRDLKIHYPDHPHTKCNVWGLWKME